MQFLNIGVRIDFYRKKKPYPFDDKTFKEALGHIKSKSESSDIQHIQALLADELSSYTSYELLCSALCNDEFELATALLDTLIQKDKECFNRNKQELFEMSVCVGHIGIMKTLVDDFGVTLFQESICKIHDIHSCSVKEMLSSTNDKIMTPFCIAAINADTQALKVYLDSVSKDQSIDRSKLLPGFYLACIEGALENVKLIIQSGLIDFTKNIYPLDYAVYSQKVRVVEELLTVEDLQMSSALNICCDFILDENWESHHTEKTYEMIKLILEKYQQCPAADLIDYANRAIEDDNLKLYDIILKHMEEHKKNDLASLIPLALKSKQPQYIYRCLKPAVLTKQQAENLVSQMMTTNIQIQWPSLIALLSNASVRQAFLNFNHPRIQLVYPNLLTFAARMGEVDLYQDVLAKLESTLDENIVTSHLNSLLGQRFEKLDVINLLLDDDRISLQKDNIKMLLNNVFRYDNAQLFNKIYEKVEPFTTAQVMQALITMMLFDSIQCFKVLIDKLGKDKFEAHLAAFKPVINKTFRDPSGHNVTKKVRLPSWLYWSVFNNSNQIGSLLLQNFQHESQKSMDGHNELIVLLKRYSHFLNKMHELEHQHSDDSLRYDKREAHLEIGETLLNKTRKCILEILKSKGQWQAFKDFVNGQELCGLSIDHDTAFKEQITELFNSIEQQRVDAYGMMQVLIGTSQHPNIDVMPEELIATLLMDYNELMASHIPFVTAELPLYKSFLNTREEKTSLKRALPKQQSEGDEAHNVQLKKQKGHQSDAMDIDVPNSDGDIAMEIEEKSDSDDSTRPFKHPRL